MRKLFQIIHLVVCAGVLIAGCVFLSKFDIYFENGMWDTSAITATAIAFCTILAVTVHITYYLSVHVIKKTDRQNEKISE